MLPSESKSTGFIPGKGFEAEPGFKSVAPGNGEINVAPVSVCHQVSTIGHLFFSYYIEIPHPSFRINWFTNSS